MGRMSTPRRPIFWFLWPQPDPAAPVDGDVVQRRPLRVNPRGPVRWAMLSLGTVGLAVATGSAILAAVAAPMSLGAFAGAAVAATALVLILRGWVVGTYVSDSGVIIDTTWRRRAVPWSTVTAVSCEPTRVPLLGLPFRLAGRRMLVRTNDGQVLPTHVYDISPDLCFRPEAFDIACQRLENWADGR